MPLCRAHFSFPLKIYSVGFFSRRPCGPSAAGGRATRDETAGLRVAGRQLAADGDAPRPRAVRCRGGRATRRRRCKEFEEERAGEPRRTLFFGAARRLLAVFLEATRRRLAEVRLLVLRLFERRELALLDDDLEDALDELLDLRRLLRERLRVFLGAALPAGS